MSEDGGRGHCEAFAKLMVQDFPELKLVRGHYLDAEWGERCHWWCVAPDGTIV